MSLFQITRPSVGRIIVLRPALLAFGFLTLGCKAEIVDGLTPPAQNQPVTAPAVLRPVSGDSQSAPTGTLLPAPLAVRVYDSVGNPYPNVTVDWALAQPGTLGEAQTLTDATGTARNVWQLGDTPGYQFAVASSSALTPVEFVGRAVLVFQSIHISPKTVTDQTGGSQQFSTTGVFTDGSIGTPNVTYTATGGIISANGLYVAGSVPGTYTVVVRQVGGSLADTAIVSLVDPGTFLTQVTLSPKPVSVPSGYSQQFSVTGLMSDGSSIVPPVTYTATGGAITSGGLYIAGSTTGTFRVIATALDVVSGTLADTSVVRIVTPPPPPPPPPPGSNPNEPAGYSQITNQTFDALTADGWGVEKAGLTLATDATAPISPSSVLRATYPAGWSAGYAPGAVDRSLPSPTSLYYRIIFKHSTNFEGQTSGTNKLGYVWIHNNPSVFLSAEGRGSGNLVAHVRLQNVADRRDHLVPNQGPSGIISRGVWHSWEVQLISNTPGTANGIVRAWLDGVLITQYTDVQFAGVGQSNTWDLISIYPVWGGVGSTVTSTMTLDFDNFYVSRP
jgi:hypothetical protein